MEGVVRRAEEPARVKAWVLAWCERGKERAEMGQRAGQGQGTRSQRTGVTREF